MPQMMVTMKVTKSNYDKWREVYDGDAERRAKFMRDDMVGKVDDNTAIIFADIFDPEGMQKEMSDPELQKIFEEMGIEHTMFMVQPVPPPNSP